MKRFWIIALALLLAACGGGQKANFSEPTDRLEVVSWWVSPSEHPAFEVLLNAFKAANPKVDVIDGTIAGGGGSNVQVALAARLRAGDPPDVWQTFLGSSLRAWVDAGQIADVSAVYEQHESGSAPCRRHCSTPRPTGTSSGACRPDRIAEMCCGSTMRVLRDAGVAAPGPGYTTEAFASDLAKVAASGDTPLCLGGKDRFTATELFENTLLGVIGTGRLEQDRRRLVRLAGSSTRGGAYAVRTDRLARRPECGRTHVGSGGEEAGDR